MKSRSVINTQYNKSKQNFGWKKKHEGWRLCYNNRVKRDDSNCRVSFHLFLLPRQEGWYYFHPFRPATICHSWWIQPIVFFFSQRIPLCGSVTKFVPFHCLNQLVLCISVFFSLCAGLPRRVSLTMFVPFHCWLPGGITALILQCRAFFSFYTIRFHLCAHPYSRRSRMLLSLISFPSFVSFIVTSTCVQFDIFIEFPFSCLIVELYFHKYLHYIHIYSFSEVYFTMTLYCYEY